MRYTEEKKKKRKKKKGTIIEGKEALFFIKKKKPLWIKGVCKYIYLLGKRNIYKFFLKKDNNMKGKKHFNLWSVHIIFDISIEACAKSQALQFHFLASSSFFFPFMLYLLKFLSFFKLVFLEC